MHRSRRQMIATAAAIPLAMSTRFFAACYGPRARSAKVTDAQFTAAPAAPTDQELQLLAAAVEAARRASASDLVQDARFSTLHAQPVFRLLVKAIARDSVLTVPREDEPGTRILAAGTIQDAAGHPVAGATAYVYHTSAKGWYSDKAAHIRAWSGDARHARLFGYLKTGADGSFEVHTIRPGGYPQHPAGAHSRRG